MTTSAKWEAYTRLRDRIPACYLCRTEFCCDAEELREAWPKVANKDGIACLRTDKRNGFVTPFLPFITLEKALGFVQLHGAEFYYLPNEPLQAHTNGKAVKIDEESVLVEWGYCETARDFDAGRCEATSIAIGYGSYTVWGETVLRCSRPVYWRHLRLHVVHRELLYSGLKESAWSLTDEDKRVVFWG